MILPFALLFAVQITDAVQPGEGEEAAMVANCNARKFETVVQVFTDGKPRSSRVKLCGQIGQSDADWARTLKDAADKVLANPKMPQSVKDQIVTALNAELAKLPQASEPPQAQAALPPVALTPAPPLTAQSAPSFASKQPSQGAPVEYSTLPPMPAPKPELGGAALAAAAASAPPPLAPVRLTFRCLSTNNLSGEGACDLLERGTVVTVRADENVPNGTSLRFLRRGDNRAEVDLAALRSGQKQQFLLPARVCQGVTGSRVEIQVVRAAGKSTQVVDTRGPYELRC